MNKSTQGKSILKCNNDPVQKRTHSIAHNFLNYFIDGINHAT